MSSTDTFVANAERYAAGFEAGRLPMPPASHVLVVACMDARLNPYGVLGLSEGDAHVVRNAGGVVTDDVIRSITISQRLLGTNEIILIHHTDCGMLTFHDDDVKAQIEAETGIRPPFALEAFPDLDLLLTVDPQDWKLEADRMPEFFAMFGEHLPERLWELHQDLIDRLSSS